MIEASGEAQRLALVSKHLSIDPYRVKNMGRENAETGALPPHPHPIQYRALLYAMAEWLEEQEYERLKLQVEAASGAKIRFA